MVNSEIVTDFILSSFKLRDIIHSLHLTTDYYSQHIALGEFYEQIVGKIDDVSEYFLCYENVKNDFETKISNSLEPTNYCLFNYNLDPVTTLTNYENDCLMYLKEHLDSIEYHGGVMNIIDEIHFLIRKTCYLLKLN